MLPIKAVSGNGLYLPKATKRGASLYHSDKGRKFRLKAHEYLKKQWGNSPLLTCKLKAVYEFHFKDKRDRDVDNYIKATQDALTGVVIEDDKLIYEVTAKKFMDCPSDKIVIMINAHVPTAEEMKRLWAEAAEEKPAKKQKTDEEVIVNNTTAAFQEQKTPTWKSDCRKVGCEDEKCSKPEHTWCITCNKFTGEGNCKICYWD